MIQNLPVKTVRHGELTIEGYSRAAVQTYWRVPELKIGFDLGAQPWSFMGTPSWFVSHTHIDHVVALPVYVGRRRMMKMEPPVIYLPEAAIDPAYASMLKRLRLNWGSAVQRQSQRRRHQQGKDVDGLIADPLFVDAEHYDFHLKPDSPALKIGFRPIDMSHVGPRPKGGRD